MAEQTAAPSNAPAPTQQQAPAQQQQAARDANLTKLADAGLIEARRTAISNDPAFWGGKDVAKTRALRAEMSAITQGRPYIPEKPEQRVPTIAERFQKAADDRAAAAKKAETDRVATLPNFEKRRLEITRALTDKNSKLSDQDRTALTNELRRIVAGQLTPEEHQQIVDAPVSELREAIGFTPDKVLPSLRDQWDEHSESEVLASFLHAGASPEAARKVMDWFVDTFNRHGGDVGNADYDALEGEFRTMATPAGLSKAHVNALVKYERERMVG